MPKPPLTVAYFTMEVALSQEIPTFAGGLGVLAADLMRSCADLAVPSVCVTMCWQHGYMHQEIDHDGTQRYSDVAWNPSQFMKLLPSRIHITIEGRDVSVGAWHYDLQGTGSAVPILFLETNLPENHPEDRDITKYLYGGDGSMRIKQELVLGIGGVRILRELGYSDIGTFHMNEGHSAFLTLELLRERDFQDDAVRKSCAFTTHTPVKAGHDVFHYDLAWKIAGDLLPWHIKKLAGEEQLSMTHLAMHLSHYTCGVSRVHGVVSNMMFPGEHIDFITNGIHHPNWASKEMQALFDLHIPGWRENPTLLEKGNSHLPDDALWKAHQVAKKRLLKAAQPYAHTALKPEILTIASARRVVSYKRPELLYTNLERLKEVGGGKIQIIHAGNAHPQDAFGQDVIKRMIERSDTLKDSITIVYMPNYNPDLAKILTAGADVWLNTPMRLHEASGTSGMKACINGVLNLSTLDGWWVEGYEQDSEAGWRIGPLAEALADANEHRKIDAEDLYTQLQYEVIPEYYYENRARWIHRMKRSIGLMSTFNTHRCIREYIEKAWGGQ